MHTFKKIIRIISILCGKLYYEETEIAKEIVLEKNGEIW